jgi:hypothetical protein
MTFREAYKSIVEKKDKNVPVFYRKLHLILGTSGF